MSKTQRKKKLNKPYLQLKMIGIFLAISGFAAFGQALLLSQSLMNLSVGIEDAKVARVVHDAMPGILTTNLMWTSLFLLPFIFLVGLQVTHRIAGPAYRIETYLRQVAEDGDISQPCTVRQHDELKNLAGAINRTLAKLADQRQSKAPSLVTPSADESTEPSQRASA